MGAAAKNISHLIIYYSMINLCTSFIPDLRFRHPFSMLISGSTGVGKSHFIKNVIECGGADVDFDNIFYFMPRLEQIDLVPLKNQELFLLQGLPDEDWIKENIKEDGSNNMIVIDDQWGKCLDNEIIYTLLTHDRRHRGVSLCFISQNFFEKAKNAITLR